jgi:xylose isomerase
MFQDASKIKDISAAELIANWNINEGNINEIKKLFDNYNLEISSVIVDIFTQARWSNGGFATKDSKVQIGAIDEVKKYMDISAELGYEIINPWFSHNGYVIVFKQIL